MTPLRLYQLNLPDTLLPRLSYNFNEICRIGSEHSVYYTYQKIKALLSKVLLYFDFEILYLNFRGRGKNLKQTRSMQDIDVPTCQICYIDSAVNSDQEYIYFMESATTPFSCYAHLHKRIYTSFKKFKKNMS